MPNSTGLAAGNPGNPVSGTDVELARKKNLGQERVQRFKNALLKARSVILEELSPAGSSMTESPVDAGADVLDRSASDLERTLSLLLRERDRNKLKAIDDALERIQEGTFGYCEDCGDKIPQGRLEVMPFATTCIDCKSLQEKRDRLLSGENERTFSYE
jgi:DnaK suppressor protein